MCIELMISVVEVRGGALKLIRTFHILWNLSNPDTLGTE